MAVTWLALMAATLAGGDVPSAARFARFPATISRVARPAPVRLNEALSRSFRSMLREAALGKPNFAGHYVLAQIGCGAGCIRIAAINSATGAVAWFPATVSGWPLEVTEPLQFRRDSYLLVIHGMLDEHGTSKMRMYLFRGARFRPVGGTSDEPK